MGSPQRGNGMEDLMQRLIAIQEAQVAETQRRAGRELDNRLKLEAKLQHLTAEDDATFLQEIDELELQLRKVNVETWRLQYRYFDQALAGRAKKWVRDLVQYGRGRDLYMAANAAGADERAWYMLYHFMRRELMLSWRPV